MATRNDPSSLAWFRGICIEFDTNEMDFSKGILRRIGYSDVIPTLGHNTGADIREAFLNKTPEWEYEKEWRYISGENESFLEFNTLAIKRVLLGARFLPSDIQCINFWLSQYNPPNPPTVVKMMFASTDYGLYEETEMIGRLTRMG